MNITIGDYKIESDSMQFVVKKKRIVEESKRTKAENIGDERWIPIAYAVKFEQALLFVPQEALRDNDDIVVIKEKLDQIQADIKAIKTLPIIAVKEESKIDIEEVGEELENE